MTAFFASPSGIGRAGDPERSGTCRIRASDAGSTDRSGRWPRWGGVRIGSCAMAVVEMDNATRAIPVLIMVDVSPGPSITLTPACRPAHRSKKWGPVPGTMSKQAFKLSASPRYSHQRGQGYIDATKHQSFFRFLTDDPTPCPSDGDIRTARSPIGHRRRCVRFADAAMSSVQSDDRGCVPCVICGI